MDHCPWGCMCGQDRNHNAVPHIVALLVNGILMGFCDNLNVEIMKLMYILSPQKMIFLSEWLFLLESVIAPNVCGKSFQVLRLHF